MENFHNMMEMSFYAEPQRMNKLKKRYTSTFMHIISKGRGGLSDIGYNFSQHFPTSEIFQFTMYHFKDVQHYVECELHNILDYKASDKDEIQIWKEKLIRGDFESLELDMISTDSLPWIYHWRMVRCVPKAIIFIPEDVQMKYTQVALAAVEKNPNCILFIKDHVIRIRPEIACKAVHQKPSLLYNIAVNTQIDFPEIPTVLISKDPFSVIYLERRILKKSVLDAHPHLYILALKNDVRMLGHIPDKIQIANPDAVLQAIIKMPSLISRASLSLLHQNPNILFAAVINNNNNNNNTCDILSIRRTIDVQVENPFIALTAVVMRPFCISTIHRKVQRSFPHIPLTAVRLEPDTLKCIPKSIQKLYPDICSVAIQKKANSFKYVANVVKMLYPELCLKAINMNPHLLQYVPYIVQHQHPQIPLAAVLKNVQAMTWVARDILILL